MPRDIRERLSRDSGFTLIELLVVILTLGVLAAIALPTFLNQRQKGQDSAAKSDARNLASLMETCVTSKDAYTDCEASQEVQGGNLPLGGGSGEVDVTAANANSYTIVATSKSGNTFTIDKAPGTAASHTCGDDGDGGCPPGGAW